MDQADYRSEYSMHVILSAGPCMWGKRGGGEHNVFIAEDERERGMPTDKAGGEKDLRLWVRPV